MSVDDPDRRLLTLAALIDEDRPVDWDAAVRAAPDEGEMAVVSELRVLADVALVSRDPDNALSVTHSRTRGSEQVMAQAPKSWGPLTILGPIGRGAFGSVFRARDTLNREVALKLFDVGDESASAQSARVLQEGRLLARVRHPNVVMVHGVDSFHGRVGLWMELIQGRTLEEELRTRGVFSAHEATLIGLDLCRALAAVHAAGILHRDVKAHNVMREAGGRIVLMDFGAGSGAASAEWWAGVDVAGTPLYMAPEIFAGRPAGRTSDFYGLGVLLYHLVTGRYPVEGSSRVEIRRAHEQHQRTRLRDLRADVPDGFVQVVERALTSDPDRRYQTAGEFEDALASSLGVGDIAPIRPRPGPARVGRRHIIAVCAIGASLAIAGVWYVWPSRLPIVDAYTVKAAFYKVSNHDEARLSAGDRVAPGDQLSLKVEASRAVYVYVVNEDEHGESYLLFPLPGQEPVNPLPSGVLHKLPGRQAGREVHWQVTSAGGREHFLIFVSPAHLAIFDTMLQALPYARTGRPVSSARLPEAVVGRLRGVGGLVSSNSTKTTPLSARFLFEMARPLTREVETAQDLWVRHMTLENPGR